MDASIILQGQAPDILGAMDRGRAAAENQINLNRQNALAQLYKTQGAGILAGDQGALNALAGVDPGAAMDAQSNLLGMESTRLGMDQTRQQMAVLDENNKRAAEEYARGLSKEQAAAEAAEIEAGVKQALMAPDATTFDALMVQIGQPDMVGQFENRDMLASQFMSVAEILKMGAPPEPLSKEGKFAADKAAGLLPADAQPTDTGTTFNIGGGSDKQIFDTLGASTEKAASAAVGLNALTEATKALDGGAITGFAADQRLYLSKLGQYLGITDPEAVQNTETFRAAIAPQVSAMIKATVGSANISNSDREFAEKAAAGSISLDEGSIKRMIKIMDKMGREAVKLHNKKVDLVYPPGKGFDRERALFLVEELVAAPVTPDGTTAPAKEPVVVDGYSIKAID